MTPMANCPEANLQTTLNYCLPNPDGTSLYYIRPHPMSSAAQANYIIDARNVIVQNLRAREQDFSLDRNGFEFLAHQTTERFADNESIETEYYAEVRELLKKHTGAHHVVVLGHKLRQGRQGDSNTTGDTNNAKEPLPVHIVHSDRTPESAIAAVREHLGEDGERLLQGRVRFINVWRPIGQTVHREPLAVADWQTSSDMSDLLPLQISTTECSFHACVARFNPKHVWYYLKHQTPSEVTLIKCYDSRTDDCARLCLHSAFRDPGSQDGAPGRRSIEVNTLVFG